MLAEQAAILYNTSWFSLGACLYGLYQGHYDMAIVPGAVFLTSINFWRDPVHGWRRTLDIVCVQCCLYYQLLRAAGSQFAIPYMCIKIIGMLFFPISLYYYQKGDIWTGVYLHTLLHFFANVANVVLYSGTILAIRENPLIRGFLAWWLLDAEQKGCVVGVCEE